MRGLLCLALITLLAATAFGAADKTEPDPLSLRVRAGVGMNTGNIAAYDYLTTAGMVGGDISYRLNKNVALVPVSLSFYFYSGSQSQNYNNSSDGSPRRRSNSGRLASTNSYVDPWIYPSFYNTDYYYYGGYGGYYRNPPNLAWGVSMTPGIMFQSTGRQLFNFYGQLGAGVYRHNQKSSSYYGVGRLSQTNLALSSEAGVDIVAVENVHIMLGGGYMWIHDNPAFNGIVHLNMGFRLGF